MPELGTLRILAIQGGPHREGNTATLMRWVVEGCVEAGAEVEWIHVAELNLCFCQGCFACLRQGACPIPDDFPPLLERLRAVDGFVVGSPVYEGEVTAQLKVLMDRLALLVLYADILGDKFSVGVATSGLAPTRHTAKSAALFGQCSGTIGATVASLRHGYLPLTAERAPRLPRRARALGRRLVQDIRRPHHRASLQVAWIRFLRGLLTRFFVRRHPEMFRGVIRILNERGIL